MNTSIRMAIATVAFWYLGEMLAELAGAAAEWVLKPLDGGCCRYGCVPAGVCLADLTPAEGEQ